MKHLEDSMEHVTDIETIVYSAFAAVTPEDSQAWITTNIYKRH